MTTVPESIEQTRDLLAGAGYIADRGLATALFLALRMQRPAVSGGGGRSR